MIRRRFWVGLGIVGYAYAGYPAALWLLCRLQGRPAAPEEPDRWPAARLIVAAHNEAGTIGRLLASCAALDYPPSLLSLTVVLDGCTDATADVVEAARPGLDASGVALDVVNLATRCGKGPALTVAAGMATEPILAFRDANVVLAAGSLRALVGGFECAGVGAVAGARRSLHDNGAVSAGDRAYWGYETAIKHMEGQIASVAGADGALYAVRRELFVAPTGCADDLEISLAVVAAGSRLAFARDAIAFESSTPTLVDEFRRKLRTQTCALRAFRRFSVLLSPRHPVVAWMLFSHKLPRYAVPYALLVALSGVRLSRQRWRDVFVYGAAGTLASASVASSTRRLGRLVRLAAYAGVAQAAAAVAPFAALRGRGPAWKPARR